MHENRSTKPQKLVPESDFLHDLSSPLTVTLGALEAIEMNIEKIGDAKSIDRVQRALTSLRKIISMVSERKVVARKIESGR
jgi:signal transduction histidine kinase